MSNNFLLIVLYAVGFIAIFYFMAIRPQQRQRRAHEQLVSAVKRGDKVVTAGGIYGTVKRTDDAFILLEVAKGVEIKVARRAVSEVVSEGPTVKPEKAEKPALEEEEPGLPPAQSAEEGDPSSEA